MFWGAIGIIVVVFGENYPPVVKRREKTYRSSCG